MSSVQFNGNDYWGREIPVLSSKLPKSITSDDQAEIARNIGVQLGRGHRQGNETTNIQTYFEEKFEYMVNLSLLMNREIEKKLSADYLRMDVFLYFFIGVFSSYVGTTTGLAGGVILFAFLGGFFPINAVVPMHASLQIGSNASRVMFLRKQLDIKVLLLFLILVIPGAYLGSKASLIVNKELLQQALGLIIITIAFKNLINRKAVANVNHSRWIIIILGFLSSFFGMIIGVVAPFLAPFFLRAGFRGKILLPQKVPVS